jgi:multiple antibiotic resistance protein
MRRIVEFAASAIVMFLVTIGPLETAAIFGVLTAGVRRSLRPRLAIQAVAIAGGVLVVFAIGGTKFLQLLQVSMPAFEVAAGILLLLQSIELIFAHPGGLSALTTGEEIEAERSSEIAVFPLASRAGKHHRSNVADGAGRCRSAKNLRLFRGAIYCPGADLPHADAG